MKLKSAFVFGFVALVIGSVSNAQAQAQQNEGAYCQSAYGLSGKTGLLGLGGYKPITIDGQQVYTIGVSNSSGQLVMSFYGKGHAVNPLAELIAEGGPETYVANEPLDGIGAEIYVQRLKVGMYGSPWASLEVVADGVKYRSVRGGSKGEVEMKCSNNVRLPNL